MEENLFEDDFRETAIKASLQGMKIKKVSDPWNAPFSYCLPTGIPASALRFPNQVVIFCMLPAFLCFVLSGACAVFGQKILPAIGLENIHPMLAFAVLFGIGSLLGPFGSFYSQYLLKKLIGDRYNKLTSEFTSKGLIYFAIEDSESYKQLKFCSEDMGYMAFDYENACLRLEGVRCQYLIHARNVINIEDIQIPQNKVLLITYQIGKLPLTIALSAQSEAKLFLSRTKKAIHAELSNKVCHVLETEPAASPIFD